MHSEIKYYRSLDGLRAIAAIGVIIAHYFTIRKIPDYPAIASLAALGGTGVSLFFVLSGFVITRILLFSRDGSNYFKSFYIRRVLRIFPLYIVSLLAYYYVPFLLGIAESVTPFSSQIYYWTYLQNFASTFNWPAEGPTHFWSLAVEEHFYLMWPAIIYLSFHRKTNTLALISALLILLPLLLRYFMLSQGFLIDVFTFTRLDQLTLGGILALFEIEGFLEKKYNRVYLFTFILGLLLIVFTSILPEFWMDLLKHNAFGICYFGLIALAVTSTKESLLTKFLSNPIMQYLGKISYGIYVWHLLASQFVNRFLKTESVIFNFVTLLALTILISAVSFQFLETPFLKLKRYFSYSTN